MQTHRKLLTSTRNGSPVLLIVIWGSTQSKYFYFASSPQQNCYDFLFPVEINSMKNMRYIFSLKYLSMYDEATENYKIIILSFHASFLCIVLVHKFRLLNLSANNLNLLHCLHVCTYETLCTYIYQLPSCELSRVRLQCFKFKYCH